MVKQSSLPLPQRTISGSTFKAAEAAMRKEVPSGSGYRSSRFDAETMASATRGDGGYGFSLVLSLMTLPDCGCSPGVYGLIATISGRNQVEINNGFKFLSTLRSSRWDGIQRLYRSPSAKIRLTMNPILTGTNHRCRWLGTSPSWLFDRLYGVGKMCKGHVQDGLQTLHLRIARMAFTNAT